MPNQTQYMPFENKSSNRSRSSIRDLATLADIKKSDTDRYRVRIVAIDDLRYADIRVFFQDKQGQFRPTKQGVMLSPLRLQEVISALSEAANKLKEERQ